MILFFDRNVGITIPKVLRQLKLPVSIAYHQEYFPMDSPDDTWLGQAGAFGWVVLSLDSKFHVRPTELRAIRDYELACFYLWGGAASNWETLRGFARAYDRIIAAANDVQRPFVFRVSREGRLQNVALSR